MATNRKLGKTTDIRMAMLRTLTTDLIMYGKVETTAHGKTDTITYGKSETVTHNTTEEVEDDKTETVTHNTTNTLTHNTNETLQHGKTDTLTHNTTETLTHGKTETFTHGEQIDRDGTITKESHITGNIGVTTSQQMLEQEIEISAKLNVMQMICDSFKERFCLLVY